MSYIGKIEIGQNSALIGSTLYGVCNSEANSAQKVVILNNFDNLLNGITIHVRFIRGNTIDNEATLQVGSSEAIDIVGNFVCNANDVIAFTYYGEQSNSNWYVNRSITVESGDSNGQIKVNGQNVQVNGLGSAAYTDTGAYAVNNHNHDNSYAPIWHSHDGTYAPINNPTFTGTVTLQNDPTSDLQAATKRYVDDAIGDVLGNADALVFKGTIGANGTVNTLPTNGYSAGWTYRVITAGTYANQNCEVGDLIIAINDNFTSSSAVVDADWTVAQGNLDGTVIGPVNAVGNNVAIFNGNSGKLIKDSGFILEKSVPSNAALTDTTYTLTDGQAYTSHDLTGDSGASILASVDQGILTLAEGIKFTTGAVGASLTSNTTGVQ